nr:integrase, catalytic region, zinc finger, CCHC-type, peptidase aspartic, catalytic [Tanacetum cinerariifolium]
ENGVALDDEQLLFITGGQDNTVDEDVDEQPVQDLALNVDNVFQADECDAFDSDVDEAPIAQTMFMADLSSADPVYDQAEAWKNAGRDSKDVARYLLRAVNKWDTNDQDLFQNQVALLDDPDRKEISGAGSFPNIGRTYYTLAISMVEAWKKAGRDSKDVAR